MARTRGLRRFSAFLVEEGLAPRDALETLKSPKVDVKVPAGVTDDQLRAMIATCDKTTFEGCRDEALIRLMAESMVRASEALSILLDDVDLRSGTAIVRRGKMGRGRIIQFGSSTARSLDRMIRKRKRTKGADLPSLFVSTRGSAQMSYEALHKVISKRSALAGFKLKPHTLRSHSAIKALRSGMTPNSVMTLAGWQSSAMLARYVAAASTQIALDEARKLDLGL